MTSREQITFRISVAISFVIWSLFVGYKFTFVILTALLIHEYGHYRQMGREGITKKTMLAIPLMGGLAISHEGFKTCFSEAKIAIAGPVFGLGSAIGAMALYLATGNLFFATATIFICLLNLFNLVFPVAPLDGGRLIKSILASIHDSLVIIFFFFSFFICVATAVKLPSGIFMAMIIGYLNWREFNYFMTCKRFLRLYDLRIQKIVREGDLNQKPIADYLANLKIEKNNFIAKHIQPKMSWGQCLKMFGLYLATVVGFVVILVATAAFSNITTLDEFGSCFRHLF